MICKTMEYKRILITDDEEDIREILKFNLENEGFETDCAASAEEALEMLGPKHGLILLDVMMSGMSGFRMAEYLRKDLGSTTPIIFLTARSAENDMLTGFATGGDDYIAKPFSIHEVIARVKAVLRRSSLNESEDISGRRVRIDTKTKMVYADDVPVVLSRKEFEVLKLLTSNPGKIYSREDIIRELWTDAPYVLDRTVDVHIARIRSKLGTCKNCITNRSGYGYSFNDAE